MSATALQSLSRSAGARRKYRSAPLAERLERKIEPCLITGCWLWSDALRNGYGRLFVNGRAALAHRVAYEVHVGPIPDEMYVCHRCDTPACVNPAHLFLGTHADNMADMWTKCRHSRGSARTKAKLTEEVVAELRARQARGERVRGRVEARRLGVSEGTMSKILNGHDWAHVQADHAGSHRPLIT